MQKGFFVFIGDWWIVFPGRMGQPEGHGKDFSFFNRVAGEAKVFCHYL